jgi:sterol-4alpha-carboxylate 3-dehydrogenase (decarboxylating)
MSRKIALVTGALGFTGRALVERLLTSGYEVRALDLRSGEAKRGVTYFEVDLGEEKSLDEIVRGVEVIFHIGALVPFNLGRRVPDEEVTRVNVHGTGRLVQSAQREGVKRFVLASSTGVVFAGEHIEHGDESLPPAATPNDHYSRTKAMAERLVREADRDGGLRTLAIRPNGIWGPGEKHHIPKVLKVARMGLDRVIFGADALTDFTHRENLVEAFVCADRALGERPEVVGGQAYFVTDGTPIHTMRFFDPLLEGLGYKTRRFAIPDALMMPLAHALEAASRTLAPVYSFEPFLTPADIRKVIKHNYFVSERAKKELGYAPVISYEEGMRQCIEHELHGR